MRKIEMARLALPTRKIDQVHGAIRPLSEALGAGRLAIDNPVIMAFPQYPVASFCPQLMSGGPGSRSVRETMPKNPPQDKKSFPKKGKRPTSRKADFAVRARTQTVSRIMPDRGWIR